MMMIPFEGACQCSARYQTPRSRPRPMRQLCVHGLREWADGVNATSAAVYVQPRSQFPVSRS